MSTWNNLFGMFTKLGSFRHIPWSVEFYSKQLSNANALGSNCQTGMLWWHCLHRCIVRRLQMSMKQQKGSHADFTVNLMFVSMQTCNLFYLFSSKTKNFAKWGYVKLCLWIHLLKNHLSHLIISNKENLNVAPVKGAVQAQILKSIMTKGQQTELSCACDQYEMQSFHVVSTHSSYTRDQTSKLLCSTICPYSLFLCRR